MSNRNLQKAKESKNDEFYTLLRDIENELRHYKDHFKNKVVYLNCDDPEHSNFWQYFMLNFEFLGLKKLISTHYHATEPTYKLEYYGVNKEGARVPVKTDLEQNGDFRSPESIELLKESDIVVTNPPFSLFREYVAQLLEYEKQFLIIGSWNAAAYKEVYPNIQDGKLWLGYNNSGMEFIIPNDAPVKTGQRIDEEGIRYQKLGNIAWYTNLDHSKRHEKRILYRSYTEAPESYPRYVNYDGIEVSKVADIPMDYTGVMGVPITYLDKHNPEQFEIVGHSLADATPIREIAKKGEYQQGGNSCYIEDDETGKYKYRRLYSRVFIRNKNPQEVIK